MTDIPIPSETAHRADETVDWPQDEMTRSVLTAVRRDITDPALDSYADDGNMEALDVPLPYTVPGHSQDIGAFTGATGPGGRIA